jgi:hypothetical protein
MKCIHRNCEKEADFKVYWPGRAPALYCELHKDMATNVANNMGFQLIVENLDASKLAKIDPTNLGSEDWD